MSQPTPEKPNIVGVWVEIAGSDQAGHVYRMYVDANNAARVRTGDIVRGREAVVYASPQSEGGVTFDAKIQEGDFDCKAKSVRWRALAGVDLTKRMIHTKPMAQQSEYSPLPEHSPSISILEFLCGSGAVGKRQRAYFLFEAARSAFLIMQEPVVEGPAPPAPNANWDGNEPPLSGAWRIVDEQVMHTQLVDTASMAWQRKHVRAWVAVTDGLAGDSLPAVVTETRVEVDCEKKAPFIMVVRELGPSSRHGESPQPLHADD